MWFHLHYKNQYPQKYMCVATCKCSIWNNFWLTCLSYVRANVQTGRQKSTVIGVCSRRPSLGPCILQKATKIAKMHISPLLQIKSEVSNILLIHKRNFLGTGDFTTEDYFCVYLKSSADSAWMKGCAGQKKDAYDLHSFTIP